MVTWPGTWARAVSERRREAGYLFRIQSVGPWAENLAGLEWFPRAFFLFSFVFFFFSFLFSYFLYGFCKFALNCFKLTL
jgi:hypothetical protein